MYFRRHTLSLPGRIFVLLTNKGPLYMSTQVSQGLFGQVRSTRHQVDCDRTRQTQQGKGVQDHETAQVARRLAGSSITVRQGDLYQIRATHTETHPKPTRSCEDFHAIDTNPNHGQVWHRLESTWKSATRPTDGYTRWGRQSTRNRSAPFVSRSSGRQWRVGIAS